MSNYLNIPFLLPFKFLPNTTTPGMHFDDDWACNQIKNFETRKYYVQKWNRAIKTKLQIVTTTDPEDLKLYNNKQQVVKQFEWSIAGSGSNGENAWETEFDVTDVAEDGVYYLYQKNTILSVVFEAISEGIYIKNSHKNLLVFEYKNSFNDFGVIFSTGIKMRYMCEAGIMDFNPERDRNAFIDQVHNVKTLSAYPFRTFKLVVGTARGMSPYNLDILNRIFCCDTVKIYDGAMVKGLQYETAEGAKWEIGRSKAYPLIGGSIEILPAKNLSGIQFNDESELTPGVVVAYDIENDLFGQGNVAQITDIETV